jgi:hypothetical protein
MHRSDRSNSFTSVGQALTRSGHPVLEEAVNRHKALSPLKNAWQRSVAQPLCRHAEPVSLRNGVLTVLAESPVWANLLRNTERSVVAALREAGLAEIKSLRIRMSPPQSKTAAIPPAEEQDSEDNRKFRRLFAQLRRALD